MQLNHAQIVSLIIGASFAAGLNVYAMLATLGLLGHFHLVQLPPALHTVENPFIIAVSVAMFVLHFFADKIPAFDVIWNGLHTFIRIPLAALVAYAATSQLSPTEQIASTALAGVIAAIAHTGKFAARAAVTPSPEPFSNIALSTGEDAAAIGLTWFATRHPYLSAVVAIALVVVAVILIRMFARAVKALFRRGLSFSRRDQEAKVVTQAPPAA
ncbi:MAG TPA: DUF4126 domain-containing protein [Terriglobales bacterium]|nr:DUF4126 domain-containing protein [Terriglobales bacterium]